MRTRSIDSTASRGTAWRAATLLILLAISPAWGQAPRGEDRGYRLAPDVEEPKISATPDLGNVAYDDKDASQTLDVYFAKSGKPAPAVVFLHGGGWRRGSKDSLPAFLLTELQPLGVSIVSVDYRLLGAAPYPAQADDSLRAVQFVRNKAREWNIDPGRIGVMGVSAGAHLALMVGAHDEVADPQSDDPVERQSSRARCVVSFSGPADFRLRRDAGKGGALARGMFGLPADGPESDVTEAMIDSLSPGALPA